MKNCCDLRWIFGDRSCYKIELEMGFVPDLRLLPLTIPIQLVLSYFGNKMEIPLLYSKDHKRWFNKREFLKPWILVSIKWRWAKLINLENEWGRVTSPNKQYKLYSRERKDIKFIISNHRIDPDIKKRDLRTIQYLRGSFLAI